MAKVDNAKHGCRAKVEIRRKVLEALTPARTVVFDAFAGDGLMWIEVWKEAAGYVGCDERWHDDERCCFVADSRRVLRCLDLAPFTCFDLDADSSPWEQLIIVAARRPPLKAGEQLGLVLTDRTSLATLAGRWPAALRQVTGIKPMAADVGAAHLHEELLARALVRLAQQMGGRIARQWCVVGKSASTARYLGVIVEGVAA